jgi:hypothetical protein
MNDHALTLVHGRLYTLRLDDGLQLALMAWQSELTGEWQLLDACPGTDLCMHARHAHLIVLPNGRLEVDEGTEPSPHDPDVRAVAEGLTVDHLRPANRLAMSLFRVVAGPRYPCSRCGALLGQDHHDKCHARNLVPLFPMLDRDAWRGENDLRL